MVLEGAGFVFAVGCAGGALAELLHWWGIRRDLQLPAYARSPFYWTVTLLMVVAGGFVSWLYFGERADALLAFHVGVSTPLILQKLTTSVPPGGSGKAAMSLEARPSLRTFFTW